MKNSPQRILRDRHRMDRPGAFPNGQSGLNLAAARRTRTAGSNNRQKGTCLWSS